MSGSQEIIIPRPGTESNLPTSPIPGPSEEHFTSTFGNLLPPAQYLETSNGQIAYYTFSPTSSATTTTTTSPSRVLFLHGVQTPSLGGPLIVPSDFASRIARGEIVAERIREWQMVNHKGHTASVIAIVRDAGVLARPEI
ncbi:unnamed protein product [Aureobasidium pullulans]|nr:unnamed protein product [Aureobasidium pullulans]